MEGFRWWLRGQDTRVVAFDPSLRLLLDIVVEIGSSFNLERNLADITLLGLLIRSKIELFLLLRRN